MQSTSTLDDIDKQLSCVFASGGTFDNGFISAVANGIREAYATQTSEGGLLLSRAMVNAIGLVATTDLFMSKIGCLQTYVPGVSYSKYAKLEYVDNSSISHTVFATANGLGNFNSDQSLIADNRWKIAGNRMIQIVPSFN